MKDKIMFWLVWKLPRRLVYVCGIRLAAWASSGKYSSDEVPAIGIMDALKRWNE